MLGEAALIRVRDALARHWRLVLVLVWLVAGAIALWLRWKAVVGFGLPDTDDNLRMAQVRAWLDGQGWYDLRQYRLNPPEGFDIHWTRVVDLPIAAIQRVARPLFGGVIAEKASAALAPLIPLGVVLAAMAITVRRLVAPAAYVIATALLFLSCNAAMLMFMPLRVDHHGWQLAMLVITLAGLADPKAWRGGLTMGVSSAISLAIGLELIPFLVLGGAAIVLRWVWDRDEADRLLGYGLALAIGVALGFALFTSEASAIARCDALSLVWTPVMIAVGVLVAALSLVRDERWAVRLAVASAAGLVLAAGFALFAPQCLGRPEQISAELVKTWFGNVREAKPLYQQSLATALTTVTLPVIGVIGSVLAARQAWGSRKFAVWAAVALVAIVSLALVTWQTRQGPAAQLMAIPGATWLIWTAIGWIVQLRSLPLRLGAMAAALAILSGVGVSAAIRQLPAKPQKPWQRAVTRANALCPTLWAMRPFSQLPPATVFTFVDLGPRLVNVTHHNAIAGPYHRNGKAILDVHHAFGGSPEEARAIMQRHGATLLMICPNMSEATVHRARHPRGFYARLVRGERFEWLTPVALPRDRPLRAWVIR
ncbi:MAG: AcrB/AcrD/AcrF family protein [Sphingomonadaceae bacterium]